MEGPTVGSDSEKRSLDADMCLEASESMMKEDEFKVSAMNAWHLSLSFDLESASFLLTPAGT